MSKVKPTTFTRPSGDFIRAEFERETQRILKQRKLRRLRERRRS